jgi:hypothetical protein
MKCAHSLNSEQKECLDAVQKINNELHVITLFNSENSDERIYYEKSDKYESL